jgi:hypothetical protein
MVPQAGLEPALLSEQDFESSASTNSTTGATGDASSGATPPMQAHRYFFNSFASVLAVALP